MLKILDKHWKIVDKGCDCEGYINSPTLSIKLVLEDWVVYDVRKDKITDATAQEHGRISVIRCTWCDKLLGKWRKSV